MSQSFTLQKKYTIEIYETEITEEIPLHHDLFCHIQKMLEHTGCKCKCKNYAKYEMKRKAFMKSLFDLKYRLNALHKS